MSKEKEPAPTPAAEWAHIDHLKTWDRNPKRRTDADVREAMGSLRRFGFCAPMVAWGSKQMLVAGHARRQALARILRQDPTLDGKGGSNLELAEKNRKLRDSLTGPTCFHVPVRMREFSSMAEAEAYALRDNNDFGENDDEKLADLVKNLAEGGTDVDDLGFSEDDLAKMYGEEAPVRGGSSGDQSGRLKDEWLVLVECTDEAHQLKVISELQDMGFTVRALQ